MYANNDNNNSSNFSHRIGSAVNKWTNGRFCIWIFFGNWKPFNRNSICVVSVVFVFSVRNFAHFSLSIFRSVQMCSVRVFFLSTILLSWPGEWNVNRLTINLCTSSIDRKTGATTTTNTFSQQSDNNNTKKKTIKKQKPAHKITTKTEPHRKSWKLEKEISFIELFCSIRSESTFKAEKPQKFGWQIWLAFYILYYHHHRIQ